MVIDKDVMTKGRIKLQYEELKGRLVDAQNSNKEFIVTYFVHKENLERLDKEGYRIIKEGGICYIYLLK